ncbi:acetolactate synthase large subunit [Paenibacillus sp. BSR1-1]|uniref:acetolactate synthase large subunit n=1 Tax=Paenibacillus sp. BSR1-1 TaxID=3020845 RepID=UPI0025B23E6B|nr:acetolactate synthase large subunit [Paenibacillus sp. BSR1-1]MDN3016393.1 acetolactate synthase large subunit [Paenibacillus sp. BSR1-1]
MKVSDVLVQCLENEGVEFVFGIVGTETLDLADSLSKSKQIQFINVRHEQGAAFMADVYGRLSKKAGVCLATLGPGATNLMTGIASAQLDHSPLVALIGQAGIERQHKESHQYLDLVKLFEPATKWSTQLQESPSIPSIMRKAFQTAMMEKPGAVAITLPENFSAQMIANKPLPVTPLPVYVPVSNALMKAKFLIQNHNKPFLIIGNGVIRQDAVPELQILIETLQSPVTHSFMAKGVLPKDHTLNFYTFGFKENDEVLTGLDEADLLIVIGFDFVEKLPKDWNQKKRPIIHIDSVPAEINEYYPVETELIGNLKETLQLLNQAGVPAKSWIPAGNLHEHIKTAYQIKNTSDSNSLPFTIEDVLQSIEAIASDDTIVISDVGAHKVSIARTYQPKRPNRLIISNGLASMGIALPGAIGAKLACPDDPVICITGDGGALMNFAEIETAKRLGLSFIIIVLNDSMLKLEVQQMNKMFGQNYGVTFENPDFLQLSGSYGVQGIRANNPVEFETILHEKLLSLDGIILIDAVIQK